MAYYTICFILGFLFGIIPFSYIIARIKGVNLKEVGSGNIGATNLGRSLGLPFFLLGFILDGLKGLVPVLLAKSFLLGGPFAGAGVTGVGAILGHIFNPFFHFRSGKGVSTTIGVAIGLTPISFLISLFIWIVIYLGTYMISLASIIFAVALPLLAIILHEAHILDRILIIIIALFVIYAHRANIKRMLKGKEPKTIFWKKK